MPRSPAQAKGLLLSAILESKDPVIFMEPKILYRAAVEEVPDEAYTLPIGKAEIVKPGNDLTIISYGRPLYTCQAAIDVIEKELPGTKIELIDLRTIFPWDRKTVLDSVSKTGRAVVVHESMVNFGVGAEVAATIQDGAFLHLKAPVKRVAGWTTHTGLVWEKYILPDITRKLLSRMLKLPTLTIYRHIRCHPQDVEILKSRTRRRVKGFPRVLIEEEIYGMKIGTLWYTYMPIRMN
jgi:2-oxoisovalerate dehydrogenase E1 component beta subunit